MGIGPWIALAVLALVEAGRVAAALLRPEPPYRVCGPEDAPLDSERYRRVLGAVTDCAVDRRAAVTALYRGEDFYAEQIAAIRAAERTVHAAFYIFRPGRVSARFLEALAERAADGVEVRLLVDAFGSLRARRFHFEALEKAGGQVGRYHPLRWDTWPRFNHRSHQNILVVDGKVAFAGGAGVADMWTDSEGPSRRRSWRDSVFRIEGNAVAGLQSAFAQNWTAMTGELLSRASDYFSGETEGGAPTLVVNGTPTRGGAARSRMLFQSLIHSARKSIRIETPYFLPDASARREMADAIRDHGVDIEIIVPGRHAVPFLTRRCSRRRYGELLEAGARIFEYQPSMMHAKTMVVDGVWSVFGSTNFDPRSFGINDEINVAVCDDALAEELERRFQKDQSESAEITYEQWRRRPWWEHTTELFSAVFERQQ